jgi:hypothetical protein
MALVVEDGTGRTDAESYASVAEADTYCVSMGLTTWAATLTADKEVALRKATQYIDGRYRFVGLRYSQAQALEWPRQNAIDRDGYFVNADVVPTALKHTTAELAVRALTETLDPDRLNMGESQGDRVKVGPIEVSNISSVSNAYKTYNLVDKLLAKLVRMRGSRLLRA